MVKKMKGFRILDGTLRVPHRDKEIDLEGLLQGIKVNLIMNQRITSVTLSHRVVVVVGEGVDTQGGLNIP